MARTTWTVKGTLQLEPQLEEVETSYGNPAPLAGVRVLVEAKEFAADPTWDNWGEDVTNARGGFRITNDKDHSRRMFRVRAMFKDDELKIYPPNTGVITKAIQGARDSTVVGDLGSEALETALSHVFRLAYDVDWFTVHQDDKDAKQGPGLVDLGALTFQSAGRNDLGDRTARRHAEIWFVTKLMMGLLNSAGSGLGFISGKPVAVLHPHNNPLINDNIEQSFASPYNQVAYLVENSRTDGFDVATILHEVGHLYVYQRTHGEDALAWQSIIHGGTHDGLQKKTWVAAHEGIAEWLTHQLHRVLFGVWPLIYGGQPQSQAMPFTRQFLRGKGVEVLQQVDHSEWGWMSLLNIMRNPDIATLDVSGSDDYAPFNLSSTTFTPAGQPTAPPEVGGEVPNFLDVLASLDDHGGQGVLDRDGLSLEAFIDRALVIMLQHDSSEKAKILELLSPVPNAPEGPPNKHQEPRPQAQQRARSQPGRAARAERAPDHVSPRAGR